MSLSERPAFQHQDDEITENAAGWATALRAVAQRWRFRASAGRLGAHAVNTVIDLADRLDAAASCLTASPTAATEHAARREGDDMLRRSEERFRLLVDSVQDYAIFMLDAAGRVASWNAGAERIKQYLAEEIIGQHFSVFYTPEDVQSGHPRRVLEAAIRDGRYHEEGPRLRRDGTRFWADIVITALRGDVGELRGFAKVTRDLTERRLAEAAYNQSEERFRLMVETVQDYAIFMLDPSGVVTTWNLGAERLKGYLASEVVGKHFSIFYPIDAVRSGHPERLLEVATREGHYVEEGWRVRKDGSRFWASVVITAVRDASAQLRGFSKVTRDFTERKKVEDAIRDANASLEARVRERTATLEVAKHELEAFSYSVSHDLRAPLRLIHGFARLLADECGSSLGEQGEDYIARIQAGTQHMTAMVDDLLRLSSVSRADLHRIHFDLAEISRDVADRLSKGHPARRAQWMIPPSMPVDGDCGLLRIVMENLLGNAWKFTSKRSEARIELGVASHHGTRAVFVRDNGAGFDAAVAQNLFAPFQRFHASSEFEGTGVGLATVQRIVARHGGRIWAESQRGEGATFWFTLGDAPVGSAANS